MSNRIILVCCECYHKFKRSIGKYTVEIQCPKCKGYDVEISFSDLTYSNQNIAKERGLS